MISNRVARYCAIGLVGLSVAGAASLVDGRVNRAEAGAVCPNVRIFGTAVGITRERAKKNARGNWERKARQQFHTSRISWWNGRDRHYSSRWVKRVGFVAYAFARPCF